MKLLRRAKTKQIVFAHQPQRAFVIAFGAAPAQFRGDSTVAIGRPLERNPMDRISPFHSFVSVISVCVCDESDKPYNYILGDVLMIASGSLKSSSVGPSTLCISTLLCEASMPEFFHLQTKTRKRWLPDIRRNGSGARLNLILFDHSVLLVELTARRLSRNEFSL